MVTIRTVCSWMLVAAAACGDKSTNTGSDATGDGSTGPGTSSGPTSGDMPTSGTTGPGETTTTGGEPTTGAAGGGSCEDFCAYSVNCHMEEAEFCLADCEANLAAFVYLGAACEAGWREYLACYGALTCEDGEQGEIECASVGPDSGSTECILPVCEALCATQAECSGEADPECAFTCSYYAGLIAGEGGPECGPVNEAYIACLGGLTCQQFADETGCEAEIEALQSNC